MPPSDPATTLELVHADVDQVVDRLVCVLAEKSPVHGFYHHLLQGLNSPGLRLGQETPLGTVVGFSAWPAISPSSRTTASQLRTVHEESQFLSSGGGPLDSPMATPMAAEDTDTRVLNMIDVTTFREVTHSQEPNSPTFQAPVSLSPATDLESTVRRRQTSNSDEGTPLSSTAAAHSIQNPSPPVLAQPFTEERCSQHPDSEASSSQAAAIFSHEGKWEVLNEEELLADKETEHSKSCSSYSSSHGSQTDQTETAALEAETTAAVPEVAEPAAETPPKSAAELVTMPRTVIRMETPQGRAASGSSSLSGNGELGTSSPLVASGFRRYPSVYVSFVLSVSPSYLQSLLQIQDPQNADIEYLSSQLRCNPHLLQGTLNYMHMKPAFRDWCGKLISSPFHTFAHPTHTVAQHTVTQHTVGVITSSLSPEILPQVETGTPHHLPLSPPSPLPHTPAIQTQLLRPAPVSTMHYYPAQPRSLATLPLRETGFRETETLQSNIFRPQSISIAQDADSQQVPQFQAAASVTRQRMETSHVSDNVQRRAATQTREERATSKGFRGAEKFLGSREDETSDERSRIMKELFRMREERALLKDEISRMKLEKSSSARDEMSSQIRDQKTREMCNAEKVSQTRSEKFSRETRDEKSQYERIEKVSKITDEKVAHQLRPETLSQMRGEKFPPKKAASPSSQADDKSELKERLEIKGLPQRREIPEVSPNSSTPEMVPTPRMSDASPSRQRHRINMSHTKMPAVHGTPIHRGTLSPACRVVDIQPNRYTTHTVASAREPQTTILRVPGLTVSTTVEVTDESLSGTVMAMQTTQLKPKDSNEAFPSSETHKGERRIKARHSVDDRLLPHMSLPTLASQEAYLIDEAVGTSPPGFVQGSPIVVSSETSGTAEWQKLSDGFLTSNSTLTHVSRLSNAAMRETLSVLGHAIQNHLSFVETETQRRLELLCSSGTLPSPSRIKEGPLNIVTAVAGEIAFLEVVRRFLSRTTQHSHTLPQLTQSVCAMLQTQLHEFQVSREQPPVLQQFVMARLSRGVSQAVLPPPESNMLRTSSASVAPSSIQQQPSLYPPEPSPSLPGAVPTPMSYVRPHYFHHDAHSYQGPSSNVVYIETLDRSQSRSVDSLESPDRKAHLHPRESPKKASAASSFINAAE